MWNILVSVDQLGNALLAGDPDETLSSRTAKANLAGKRWGLWGCSFLNWFDPGHCGKAVESNEGAHAVWPSSPSEPR